MQWPRLTVKAEASCWGRRRLVNLEGHENTKGDIKWRATQKKKCDEGVRVGSCRAATHRQTDTTPHQPQFCSDPHSPPPAPKTSCMIQGCS